VKYPLMDTIDGAFVVVYRHAEVCNLYEVGNRSRSAAEVPTGRHARDFDISPLFGTIATENCGGVLLLAESWSKDVLHSQWKDTNDSLCWLNLTELASTVSRSFGIVERIPTIHTYYFSWRSCSLVSIISRSSTSLNATPFLFLNNKKTSHDNVPKSGFVSPLPLVEVPSYLSRTFKLNVASYIYHTMS